MHDDTTSPVPLTTPPRSQNRRIGSRRREGVRTRYYTLPDGLIVLRQRVDYRDLTPPAAPISEVR